MEPTDTTTGPDAEVSSAPQVTITSAPTAEIPLSEKLAQLRKNRRAERNKSRAASRPAAEPPVPDSENVLTEPAPEPPASTTPTGPDPDQDELTLQVGESVLTNQAISNLTAATSVLPALNENGAAAHTERENELTHAPPPSPTTSPSQPPSETRHNLTQPPPGLPALHTTEQLIAHEFPSSPLNPNAPARRRTPTGYRRVELLISTKPIDPDNLSAPPSDSPLLPRTENGENPRAADVDEAPIFFEKGDVRVWMGEHQGTPVVCLGTPRSYFVLKNARQAQEFAAAILGTSDCASRMITEHQAQAKLKKPATQRHSRRTSTTPGAPTHEPADEEPHTE